MQNIDLRSNSGLIRSYLLIGVAVSLCYGIVEFYIKMGTEDQQVLLPLLIRSSTAGMLLT